MESSIRDGLHSATSKKLKDYIVSNDKDSIVSRVKDSIVSQLQQRRRVSTRKGRKSLHNGEYRTLTPIDGLNCGRGRTSVRIRG